MTDLQTAPHLEQTTERTPLDLRSLFGDDRVESLKGYGLRILGKEQLVDNPLKIFGKEYLTYNGSGFDVDLDAVNAAASTLGERIQIGGQRLGFFESFEIDGFRLPLMLSQYFHDTGSNTYIARQIFLFEIGANLLILDAKRIGDLLKYLYSSQDGGEKGLLLSQVENLILLLTDALAVAEGGVIARAHAASIAPTKPAAPAWRDERSNLEVIVANANNPAEFSVSGGQKVMVIGESANGTVADFFFRAPVSPGMFPRPITVRFGSDGHVSIESHSQGDLVVLRHENKAKGEVSLQVNETINLRVNFAGTAGEERVVPMVAFDIVYKGEGIYSIGLHKATES